MSAASPGSDVAPRLRPADVPRDVDLHTVAALASSIVNRGTALLTCPAGWTCPAAWGADLLGTADYTGNPRANGVIDLGAYEN